MRDKHGIKVFENRVLKKMFGPKRGEVIGWWRKLQKEELNDLYCSSYIMRAPQIKKNMTSGATWGEERCRQDFDVET